jgi:superfamily I DNA/RNA helicase
MSEIYTIAISRSFRTDVERARRNSALRTRINVLLEELTSPFGRGKKTEKLIGAAYAHRYSLRVSDGYRVIFDLLGSILVYRAMSNHEESYKRAERLPPPTLEKLLNFPYVHKRRSRPHKAQQTDAKIAESQAIQIEDSETEITHDLTNSFLDGVQDEEQYVLFTKSSDLEGALSGKIADWMLFLPEEHKRFISQTYNGPARLFGPSGTGKTCILLHRAVHLARSSGEPVLVLSFRPTLAKVIASLKERLCGHDWDTADLIRVLSLHEFARELIGARSTIDLHEQDLLVSQACTQTGSPPASLLKKIRAGQTLQDFTGSEVINWIKGTAYKSLEIYQSLDFPKGKPQLSSVEREWLFQVFECYEQLKGERCDGQDLLLLAEANIRSGATESKWSAVLVDEFQDLNLCGLSLIKILSARNSSQLFFVGDHRQRIYRTLPSFKDAGIAIVGRSFGLAENYRNTPEIYAAAKSIYGGTGEDPDEEGSDDRDIRFSRLGSKIPVLRGFATESLEDSWVCTQVQSLIADGVPAGHIALLSLARDQTENILWEIRVRTIELDSSREGRLGYFTEGAVKRATIHGAKGLEFPIVFIVGLSAKSFSSHPWIRSEDDPNSAIGSLLYVAMTRARDRLYMSFSGEPIQLLSSADLSHFEADESTRLILTESLHATLA